MSSHGQSHTGEAQTGHRLGRKDLQGTYGIKTSFWPMPQWPWLVSCSWFGVHFAWEQVAVVLSLSLCGSSIPDRANRETIIPERLSEKTKNGPSPDSAVVLRCSLCTRGVEEGGIRTLVLPQGSAVWSGGHEHAGLILCATDAIQTRRWCGMSWEFDRLALRPLSEVGAAHNGHPHTGSSS